MMSKGNHDLLVHCLKRVCVCVCVCVRERERESKAIPQNIWLCTEEEIATAEPSVTELEI